MAQIAGSAERGDRPRRVDGSPPTTIALAAGLVLVALGYVIFTLWPQPLAPIAPDAPSVPITVAGVAFNVPPAAIRVPLQRRPGAQERLDLAFLWPSLKAPDPAARPAAADEPAVDRLLLAITAGERTLLAAERMKIYQRYLSGEPAALDGGLLALRFGDGTPYQGEDLVYDPAGREPFIARCTRPGAGAMPGTCLIDRRIGAADITVRFPRDLIGQWQDLARGVDRLIASLRSAGS